MAFIVERSMKRYVLDFKALDEWICVLRIKTILQNISFIEVQAATGEEIEKEAFYQKVEEVYDSCPSSGIKIFLEDMRAKV